MSSKPRPSSSLPKPPTTLDPTSVISDTASLTGIFPISIGANTVIHPRARIVSTYGPVTIGESCIVCERAVVGLQSEREDSYSTEQSSPAESFPSDPQQNADATEAQRTTDVQGVTLHQNVSVDPSATVEALVVGTGTLLEAGCKIGRGSILGRNCRVTPLCTVAPDAQLGDFSVVWGDNRIRRERPGLEGFRDASHAMEIEVLRQLVPSNLAKWQSAG